VPPRPRHILPVIVLAQFAGTALWFAGNAVIGDLQRELGLPEAALGYVTSAVQLGFIAGTLVFAFFALADVYSPRIVFFVCCLAGAAANAAAAPLAANLPSLLAWRFAAGFFLAGIYPVGMKIASGWFQRDLGKALGFSIGALVLGTAFPHLLKGLGQALPWEAVLIGTSALAVCGGFAMLALVPDGPHLARGGKFDPKALATVFRAPRFRASAFGYFGHMWELYAFWAFVPVVIAAQAIAQKAGPLNVSHWAFLVIGAGTVGCVAGGLASVRTGSARVAFAQLLASGACCALSPLLFYAPTPLYLAFVLFWGVVVVGDSPQFSALNAANAPPGLVGSALTIVNCIGFSITIPSIELLNWAAPRIDAQWMFLLLAPGPVLGLVALRPLLRRP
jgi:MFS family permease